ncbi:MAG: rod shape-determining protein MreD [Actinomycetota bacterium]|nr:rod shape-determining protein MreD [Actinomycetota bacterium]
MAPSVALALRLAALGLLAVVLQVSAVSQLTVFDTNADVVPLVVAFVALFFGPVVGAVFGFAVGLLIDVALVGTLGVNSLVYVAIGYGAGRLRELRDPQSSLVPLAVGAAASSAAAFGFALVQFLLGAEAAVSFELIRQLVVATLVSTLLALPVYAGVRRVLVPALPDDPRRRRRRAYTTGGLSPLSRP